MDRGTWRVIVHGDWYNWACTYVWHVCVCARAQTQRYTQKDFKKERSCASGKLCLKHKCCFFSGLIFMEFIFDYQSDVFWASLMAQLLRNLPECGRLGFDLWVGKIHWRRERLPTPVFWPAEFHGLYSLWGHKESDKTERVSLYFTSLIHKWILGLPLSQFRNSFMYNYLWPHGLQHTMLPCPSLSPGACSNSHPLSWWCHPTISSSAIPFSFCLHLSQHQSLFQWVSSLHHVAKVLELYLQHQSFQWIFRVDFL